MTIKKEKINSGFTLLFAVLIASIVFGVSIGFSYFIIRELRISIIGRESQKAFFASDGGVECVLYWDLKNDSFSTSTTSVINCAGSSPTVGGPSGISDFTLNFTNGSCVSVRVDKSFYPETRIYSYGHNTCDLSSSNRIERALRIGY